MPLLDRLYMQPMDKYEKYGRYPWKMTIHILLVLGTTLQVLLILSRINTYSNTQILQWNQLFLDKDVDADNTSLVFSYNIFGLESLESYMKWTVKVMPMQNYYDINEFAMGNYHHTTDNGDIKPIKMRVEYLDYDQVNNAGYNYEYDIERDSLGPFYTLSPKDFMDKIKRFQLYFELKHEISVDLDLSSTCFLWKLTQNYNYGMQGLLVVGLQTDLAVCNSSKGKL